MKRGSTMQNSFDATATLNNLVAVVGQRYVLTDDNDTRLYRQGRRYGQVRCLRSSLQVHY